MTIKKIGTGKASGGATTTKTSGVSGTTTLNTAAINTGMQALQTATPQDTISAIQRLSTTGTGIQPLTTLNAAIVDPSTQTPQTSIDAIQRVQAAAAVSAARAGATTTEQDATAQGILETGAFDSLSERVGDATIEILTGFGTDEFGIENYNDPEWQTAQVDSDGNLNIGVLSEELIASGLGVSQVLCRLVQESDIGTYDLVGFDSYFIMDLEVVIPTSETGTAPRTGPTTFGDGFELQTDATVGMSAGALLGGSSATSEASFSATIYTHGDFEALDGPKTLNSNSPMGTHAVVFRLYIPIQVGDYTEISIYMIAKNSTNNDSGGPLSKIVDTDALEQVVMNEMANASSPTHFYGYALFGTREGSTYYDTVLENAGCASGASKLDLANAINDLLANQRGGRVKGGSIATGGLNEEINIGALINNYLSVVPGIVDPSDTTGCAGAMTTLQLIDIPIGSSNSPKLEIYLMDEYYGFKLADISGDYNAEGVGNVFNPSVGRKSAGGGVGSYILHDQNTYTFT